MSGVTLRSTLCRGSNPPRTLVCPERICECVDLEVQTAMASRLLPELGHGKKVRGQDEICSSIIPVSPLSPRFLIS